MTLHVTINGEARELEAGTTVADVVALLPGAPEGRGVAVALDGEVVRRAAWDSTEVPPGARLEVVVAVQGG
jgi:sulfur carrier protein